ncbi:MAG: site-specific integrase [Thermoleophilia bacterium]|nr:site-specific integrase [Thermoleophilia bacterium]
MIESSTSSIASYVFGSRRAKRGSARSRSPERSPRRSGKHRRRSAFQGDDELVFCHPARGTIYRAEAFTEALSTALAAAGVEANLRAFHDLRHSAITHDAASGSSAIAVMAKAGHRNMATTETYLHLAGVVFRDEAERLTRR